MSEWAEVTPAPYAHVADYYDLKWAAHKCLAWQLLRRGYRQAANGRVEAANNLFEWGRKAGRMTPQTGVVSGLQRPTMAYIDPVEALQKLT